MFEKRGERIDRMRGIEPDTAQVKHVTDLELFKMPGASYEIIKVN